MVNEQQKQRQVASSRRRLRRLQRKEQDPPVNLCVTLSIPPHVREKLSREWILRTSTKAMLMHTLYARGVCPAPAAEVLRDYQEQSSSKSRPSNTERKFIKCGASLQQLLDDFDTLSLQVGQHIQRVVITLGPSWSRPKEHYVLEFEDRVDNKDSNMDEPSEKQEHALSRRLVRALLDEITNRDDCSLAQPSPAGSSYQVHLTLWIPNQVANDLFETSQEATGRQLLPSLVMRHDFTLQSAASNKRSQPHVVTTKVTSSSEQDDKQWKEEEGVWISLPTSLKGFRLASGK